MLDRKKGATAANHHLGITSNKRPFCYKFKGRNRWAAFNPVGEEIAPLESKQHMFGEKAL